MASPISIRWNMDATSLGEAQLEMEIENRVGWLLGNRDDVNTWFCGC